MKTVVNRQIVKAVYDCGFKQIIINEYEIFVYDTKEYNAYCPGCGLIEKCRVDVEVTNNSHDFNEFKQFFSDDNINNDNNNVSERIRERIDEDERKSRPYED